MAERAGKSAYIQNFLNICIYTFNGVGEVRALASWVQRSGGDSSLWSRLSKKAIENKRFASRFEVCGAALWKSGKGNLDAFALSSYRFR